MSIDLIHAGPLPIQLPAYASGMGTEDSSSMCALAPCVGILDGVPGFWLQPDLVLAIVSIWSVNQQIKYLFLPVSVCLSACLSLPVSLSLCLSNTFLSFYKIIKGLDKMQICRFLSLTLGV